MRAHVAAAHADVGTVRADHLDDRADVADFAVVAVVAFGQRLKQRAKRSLGKDDLRTAILESEHGS